MERLDFCSFVATLRRYIYADALGNQLDLLCLLFGSFLQSTDAEDFTFDNGQVCRWLNGTARVSPKITFFYLANENQEKLAQDMETKILTIMSDPAMAAQSECDLLMQDVSISSSKKKSLYAERDFSVSAQVAEFLSLLLCFAMQREFVKREARAKVCKQIILPPDYDPRVFTKARMEQGIMIRAEGTPFNVYHPADIVSGLPLDLRKAFLPLSGNVLERAAQVRQQQSMLRTLIRYTKETYQLGVINIEIGNEEEGHALVKEAQEIYKKLYGEIPAIMERNRQRDREYLESNGITLSEEPPKLTG